MKLKAQKRRATLLDSPPTLFGVLSASNKTAFKQEQSQIYLNYAKR